MTKILDTATSDTGTVFEFSGVQKRRPQGVVVGVSVGSGDTVTIFSKTGELAYRPTKVVTESKDLTFIGLPDSIRVDRTVDGGSGESLAYIIQTG